METRTEAARPRDAAFYRVAAAEALLARNAHFTPAGCLPFILPCASWRAR